MKNYKELEVWQTSKNLAIEIYRATERFPQPERFGLVAQVRRSATSVPANIAEGWGRGSTQEYIQFLLIARGSLMETETHLIIAQELNYVEAERLAVFQEQVQGIGQMLNRSIRVLRDSRNPKPESRTPKGHSPSSNS